MEIVLHIGPHKTGTTSIQKFLKKYSRKIKNGLYYPSVPEGHGPGHAVLAWQTLGLRDNLQQITPLGDVISKAASNGVKRLVLSAEDFSIAFFTGMDKLVGALDRHPVHLVCTFTPVARRVLSVWQEEVKHGACYPSSDIPSFAANSPSLQPTLVRKFTEALNPCRVSLILAYSSDPAALLKVVGDVIGLDVAPDPAGAPANVSMGAIEIETLRAFNAITHHQGLDPATAKAMRDNLVQLFLSETWCQRFGKVPLSFPDPAVVAFAERLAGEFETEFDRLRQDPRVTFHDTRLVEPALLQARKAERRKRRLTASIRGLINIPKWGTQ